MQWGPDADAKLFMHVLKIHNVKLDYGALAIAMGNDVTPKALTHRIAKLKSMAEDASTPAPGATPGLGLPQANKRNKTPAKSTPPATATPSPAGKKATAIAATKTSVAGAKRTAIGTVKNGTGKANGGSPLQNVAAGDNGNDDEVGEDEETEIEVKIPSKKAKNPSKKAKTATAAVKAAVAASEAESAGVGKEDDGTEYA